MKVANIIVDIANNMPLIDSALGVPILSAMIPNGTALRGINPKVIMAMLIILPRISFFELSWIMVMFIDMKVELVNPIKIRNGTAKRNVVICAKIAREMPQAVAAHSSTRPFLEKLPFAAKSMVPTVAPIPMSISRSPSPSDWIYSASLAHAGISA